MYYCTTFIYNAIHTQYGAVIDAGSSHTSLFIYRWRVPTFFFTGSSTGKVEQVVECPDPSVKSST